MTRDGVLNNADGIVIRNQPIAVSAVQSEVGIVKTPTPHLGSGIDMLYASGSTGGTSNLSARQPGPIGRQAWRKITQ